jgi:HD superfamily phosphodiesterase
MERVDKIIHHEQYSCYLEQTAAWEKERIFCHHDTNHFLNVARIGWILNLEAEMEIPKEYIYAAAMLHDIGRFRQYEDGTDHAHASAELAVDILKDCGFNQMECDMIIGAIDTHRSSEVASERSLRGILYRADKLSRECYFCKAERECDWKQDKKNEKLCY